MNEMVLTADNEIRLLQLDTLTANTAFYHVDRVARMNVMIYVLSGSIYVTEEDRDYTVNEGEMLFLKKGTHQYGKKLIETGTSWIYAHFQIYPVYEKTIEEAVDNKSIIILPKLINIHGYNDVRKRLENLCIIYNSDKNMCKKRAELGLFELFLDIEEQLSVSKTNSMVTNVDSFINCNLCRNLSGEDFEKEFHITYKYLNRIYKKYCGRSIMQTFFYERMKAAAIELRTTKKPVNIISEEMGFSDSLYFSKCFKKYAGVSPRRYRQIAIQSF